MIAYDKTFITEKFQHQTYFLFQKYARSKLFC